MKNLENVQRGEQDIIIMCVCYDHNHDKRMIMNFGPMNRNDGEKCINEIFLRAKKQMAIISSIKYADIKNKNYEGVNYFHKYLQYTGAVSFGKLKSANLTLCSLYKNSGIETSVNSIIQLF